MDHCKIQQTPDSDLALARQNMAEREAEGYLELGMPQQAIRSLGRLGAWPTLEPYLQYLWGEAYRMLDLFEEAVPPLQHAAEEMPKRIEPWVALGWCYKRTGRVDLAIESLETAMQASPDEPLLHFNLACYWSLMSNKRMAIHYLTHALSLDPKFRNAIDSESDLDVLRSEPEFRELCG